MVQGTFGNLLVTSMISDGRTELSEIPSGATDVVHVTEVKNWVTVPYDVEIEAELPDHHTHLDFAPGGASWSNQVRKLAHLESKALERSVDSSGTGSERVHCTSVSYKKASTHRWHLAQGTYPLHLTIKIT